MGRIWWSSCIIDGRPRGHAPGFHCTLHITLFMWSPCPNALDIIFFRLAHLPSSVLLLLLHEHLHYQLLLAASTARASFNPTLCKDTPFPMILAHLQHQPCFVPTSFLTCPQVLHWSRTGLTAAGPPLSPVSTKWASRARRARLWGTTSRASREGDTQTPLRCGSVCSLLPETECQKNKLPARWPVCPFFFASI